MMEDDVQYQQLNLFNYGKEYFKINKPIRLIELFSGIGAQAKALEILGVPFEHWKTCEWAVNSIKSYNAIHIKDFLEKQVDEKYYLSDKMIDYVLARTPLGDKEFKSANNIRSATSDKTAGTITTKGSGTGSSCRGEDTFIVDDMSQEQIDTMIYGKPGGIMIKENNSQGYKLAQPGDGVNLASRMKHQRGNVQKGSIQTLKAQMEIGVVVDEEEK